MSGEVLEYEAKRILNEGIDKGREEGREEGVEIGVINTLVSLVKDGILTIKDAATRVGITEAAFQQKMAAR